MEQGTSEGSDGFQIDPKSLKWSHGLIWNQVGIVQNLQRFLKQISDRELRFALRESVWEFLTLQPMQILGLFLCMVFLIDLLTNT